VKIILILFLFISEINSQVKDVFEFGSKINDYIASCFYKSNDKELNINQMDSIFSFALSIADSNIADALLFCSVGSMTYPVFKVKLPYLNFVIPFSVFTEYDSEKMKKKASNLPHKLFDDSPDTEFGDKDKVVHFFSSAYFSYLFGYSFAVHIGYFVEEFEESFKIDGKVDERDLKINELGARFGQELNYKIIFPSFILAKERSLTYGKNINN